MGGGEENDVEGVQAARSDYLTQMVGSFRFQGQSVGVQGTSQ